MELHKEYSTKYYKISMKFQSGQTDIRNVIVRDWNLDEYVVKLSCQQNYGYKQI